MKRLALLGANARAGSGGRGPLEPKPPNTLPPPQFGQTEPQTPTQMLTLPPQAAPQRVDDPLKRSEERPPDKFNLPPPE